MIRESCKNMKKHHQQINKQKMSGPQFSWISVRVVKQAEWHWANPDIGPQTWQCVGPNWQPLETNRKTSAIKNESSGIAMDGVLHPQLGGIAEIQGGSIAHSTHDGDVGKRGCWGIVVVIWCDVLIVPIWFNMILAHWAFWTSLSQSLDPFKILPPYWKLLWKMPGNRKVLDKFPAAILNTWGLLSEVSESFRRSKPWENPLGTDRDTECGSKMLKVPESQPPSHKGP